MQRASIAEAAPGRAHRTAAAGDHHHLLTRGVLGLIRAYKLVLSPLFTGSCRFTPSCSDYMATAIRVHGLGRGIWLGTRRLLRCHPFHSGGYDPVR